MSDHPGYVTNYDQEDLTIHRDRIFIVNDPWLAQDRGFFYCREDAELFVRALRKRNRKMRERKQDGGVIA